MRQHLVDASDAFTACRFGFARDPYCMIADAFQIRWTFQNAHHNAKIWGDGLLQGEGLNDQLFQM